MPSGEKRRIYYKYHDNPKNRVDQVNNILDESILKYCNDNWINFNKSNTYDNSEDRVKRFLEGCANFLLAKGSFFEDDHITKEMLNEIFDNEVHLNSFLDDEVKSDYIEGDIEVINKVLKDNEREQGVILRTKGQNEKVERINSNKKRTKFSKFDDIYGYGDKELHTYKEISKAFKPDTWTTLKETLQGKEGLIDRSKPYKSDWCHLNTLNQFEFDGEYYELTDDVKGYGKQDRLIEFDDYRDDYKWDKVLVYEQFGNLYFFNQDIDRIPNDMVRYMDL